MHSFELKRELTFPLKVNKSLHNKKKMQLTISTRSFNRLCALWRRNNRPLKEANDASQMKPKKKQSFFSAWRACRSSNRKDRNPNPKRSSVWNSCIMCRKQIIHQNEMDLNSTPDNPNPEVESSSKQELKIVIEDLPDDHPAPDDSLLIPVWLFESPNESDDLGFDKSETEHEFEYLIPSWLFQLPSEGEDLGLYKPHTSLSKRYRRSYSYYTKLWKDSLDQLTLSKNKTEEKTAEDSACTPTGITSDTQQTTSYIDV